MTYETVKSPASIDVTTATLDDPGVFPPTAETWLQDRVRWQPTDPSLGRYAGSTSG